MSKPISAALNDRMVKTYLDRHPEYDRDAPLRFMGYCIGVVGHPCGRPIYDNELGAVQLEFNLGVIGECCYEKLVPAPRAFAPLTASQLIALKRKAGKASAKVPFNRVHIRPSEPKPKPPKPKANAGNFRLPGSLPPLETNKEEPAQHWRNYGGK